MAENGQVDSSESSETPELTEKTENFIKGTKYLTKPKETLTNCVLEKSHFKKTIKMKFSVDSEFSNELDSKKRNPRNAKNQQKAF